MILVELDIQSFGGLHGQKLVFGPGFSLVEGPNEQGKSTVLACLTALLYGWSGGPRNIRDNARRRYLPWDGGFARASLTVLHEERTYRIERTFGSRRGEDTRSLTDDRTGVEIELPTGMEPGLLWTGLTLAEFCRSLLAGQLSVPVRDTDGVLFSRLTNLAASGQEDVSFPAADERLRRAQIRLRAERGGGGRINEAQRERDACAEHYRKAVADAAQRAEDLRLLERMQKQREDLREEQKQTRCLLEKRLEENAALQALYLEAERTYRTGLEEGRRLEADLEAVRLKPVEENNRSPVPRQSRTNRALLACAAVLLLSGIVAAIVLSPAWIAVAALAGIPLFLVSFWGKRNRRMRKNPPTEPADSRPAHGDDLHRRIREQEAVCAQAYARMERLRSQQAEKGPDRLDSLRFQERERAARLQRLQEETAYLEAALHHRTPDAEGLVKQKQRLDDLNEQIRADEERYESLDRARATLRTVQDFWQNDLGPQLNTRAAQWLEALTGGAYTDLRVDRELNLRLLAPADPTFRSWEYLSGATVDQAYLALRLALAECLHPKENLPVLLDDPLVQYDDRRAKSALRALLDRKGQTVLFTCQGRMQTFAGLPEANNYTLLHL